MWEPCQLQIVTGQTEDDLGNMVGGAWMTVKKTVCRHTPWSNEQISIEGREVTRNEQRFVVPIPYKNFPSCTHAVVNGTRQEIRKTIDLSPRYTIIQVRVYKE